MKSGKLFFLFFSLTLLVFCMCSKEKEEEHLPQDFVFHSLVAEKDTIYPGEEIKIKATASGTGLIYYWSASLGDILGSGAEIVYVSSHCQIGTNQITCKITNGSNQSESKTIDIVVLE